MAYELTNEGKSIDELRDILVARGYECLGEGNFSSVYSKPGERTVIKVGDNDDDWAAYATLCRQNQDNPHFPKIERIGVLHHYLVARMERLSEVNKHTFVEDHTPMLAFICVYITQSLRNRTSHWEYATLLDLYRKKINTRAIDFDQFTKYVNELALKCPRPLAQALMKIGTMRINGLEFDFEPKNFMQRADGTIVLTDPIWVNG